MPPTMPCNPNFERRSHERCEKHMLLGIVVQAAERGELLFGAIPIGP